MTIGQQWSGPPVSGRITDAFGTHSAWRQEQGLQRHTAIDIAAPSGAVLRAPAPGRWIGCWWSDSLGWCTAIEHEGYATLYAHQLRRTERRQGDPIERLDEIGVVGSTGMSTGPHVHWMLTTARRAPYNWDFTWPGGGLRDPIAYLAPGQVPVPEPRPELQTAEQMLLRVAGVEQGLVYLRRSLEEWRDADG